MTYINTIIIYTIYISKYSNLLKHHNEPLNKLLFIMIYLSYVFPSNILELIVEILL